MSYKILSSTGSGGGGGGVTLPPYPTGPHIPDGDTMAHWTFNGTVASEVNSPTTDMSASDEAIRYTPIYSGSANQAILGGDQTLGTIGATYNVPALDRGGATPVTVAFCVYVAELNTGTPLVKLSSDTGGFTEKFVLAMNPEGVLVYGHCPDSYTYEEGVHVGGSAANGRPGVPKGEWCWVGLSRNADGKSGKIWVSKADGTVDKCTWTNTAASRTGTSTRWSIFRNWNNIRVKGCMYSLILKNVASSDAELDIMRAQCGF